VYDPVLDLDTAVSAETIVDLDDAPIALSWGGTFKEGVQGSGDRVL